MTDQRQRFAQQLPTPQRTEVLSQQSWQRAPPPQASWQPAHSWPHQPQHHQPQPGWPQQAQQHWQPQQQWPQQLWRQPPQLAGQPSSEERNGALGAFLGTFFMPVLLPLLVMLTSTNKPFQRAAALQALIVQIASIALYLFAPLSMVLFVGRGFDLMYFYVPILMTGLFSLGFALLGMSRAQQGKILYAPLIGRHLAKVFRAEWPD